MQPRKSWTRKKAKRNRRKKLSRSCIQQNHFSRKKKFLYHIKSDYPHKYNKKIRLSSKSKHFQWKCLYQNFNNRKNKQNLSHQSFIGYIAEQKVYSYLKEIDFKHLMMAAVFIAVVLLRHRIWFFSLQADFSALLMAFILPTLMVDIFCQRSIVVLMLKCMREVVLWLLSIMQVYLQLCVLPLSIFGEKRYVGKTVTCRQEHIQSSYDTPVTEHTESVRQLGLSIHRNQFSDCQWSLFVWKAWRETLQQTEQHDQVICMQKMMKRKNRRIHISKKIRIKLEVLSKSGNYNSEEILKLLFKQQMLFARKRLSLPLPIIAPSRSLPGDYMKRMGENPPPEKSEILQYVYGRRATFLHYGGHGCETNLARDGFYHDVNSENRHLTRCYSCGLEYDSWEYNSRVNEYHRSRSPHCRHLAGNDMSLNRPETSLSPNNGTLNQASSISITGNSVSNEAVPNLPQYGSIQDDAITDTQDLPVYSNAPEVNVFTTIGEDSNISGAYVTSPEIDRQDMALFVPVAQISSSGGAIPKVFSAETTVTGQRSLRHLSVTTSSTRCAPNGSNSIFVTRQTNTNAVSSLFQVTAYGNHVRNISSTNATQISTCIVNAATQNQAAIQEMIQATEGQTLPKNRCMVANQVADMLTSDVYYHIDRENTQKITLRNEMVTTKVTVSTSTTSIASVFVTNPMLSEGRNTNTSVQLSHPSYWRMHAREQSFHNSNWPYNSPSPRQLAEAGFYYTGNQDIVRCFYCGIGVYRWNEGEDPWLEHGIANPNCKHLHQNKSEDFIRYAKNMRDARNSIQLVNTYSSIGKISVPVTPVDDLNPMDTTAANILKSRGYDPELITRAVLAVWRETGRVVDDPQQTIKWILGYKEGQNSIQDHSGPGMQATDVRMAVTHPFGVPTISIPIITVTTAIATRMTTGTRVSGCWSGSQMQTQETHVKSVQSSNMIGQPPPYMAASICTEGHQTDKKQPETIENSGDKILAEVMKKLYDMEFSPDVLSNQMSLMRTLIRKGEKVEAVVERVVNGILDSSPSQDAYTSNVLQVPQGTNLASSHSTSTGICPQMAAINLASGAVTSCTVIPVGTASHLKSNTYSSSAVSPITGAAHLTAETPHLTAGAPLLTAEKPHLTAGVSHSTTEAPLLTAGALPSNTLSQLPVAVVAVEPVSQPRVVPYLHTHFALTPPASSLSSSNIRKSQMESSSASGSINKTQISPCYASVANGNKDVSANGLDSHLQVYCPQTTSQAYTLSSPSRSDVRMSTTTDCTIIPLVSLEKSESPNEQPPCPSTGLGIPPSSRMPIQDASRACHTKEATEQSLVSASLSTAVSTTFVNTGSIFATCLGDECNKDLSVNESHKHLEQSCIQLSVSKSDADSVPSSVTATSELATHCNALEVNADRSGAAVIGEQSTMEPTAIRDVTSGNADNAKTAMGTSSELSSTSSSTRASILPTSTTSLMGPTSDTRSASDSSCSLASCCTSGTLSTSTLSGGCPVSVTSSVVAGAPECVEGSINVTCEGAVGGQQEVVTSKATESGVKKKKRRKKGGAAREETMSKREDSEQFTIQGNSIQPKFTLPPGLTMDKLNKMTSALKDSSESNNPQLREEFAKAMLSFGEVKKSLLQNMEKIKDSKLCCICMEEAKDIVFLPCGHMVCCTVCAKKQKDCPICRQVIQKKQKVYQ